MKNKKVNWALTTKIRRQLLIYFRSFALENIFEAEAAGCAKARKQEGTKWGFKS